MYTSVLEVLDSLRDELFRRIPQASPITEAATSVNIQIAHASHKYLATLPQPWEVAPSGTVWKYIRDPRFPYARITLFCADSPCPHDHTNAPASAAPVGANA